ncbi:hypothetical protein LN650_14090 [Klebsiella pneumoniae subsp. pneumoniae]|nr:hypothetical protein [Klebsiella pneumoniae subsp. pneumoniae]
MVSAGQTVFTVASSDARDVVFDVASPGIVLSSAWCHFSCGIASGCFRYCTGASA